MKVVIYIEGGGDTKDLHSQCRSGFTKLLEKCGFAGRMPHLVASGSRQEAFKDFQTALRSPKPGSFAFLLIDSEDPVADREQTWQHLAQRDGWKRPAGASDEHVLLMTTCMETWIVADHAALKSHYGAKLKSNGLPSLVNLEAKERHDIHDRLVRATKDCSNCYSKGKRSFEILAHLNPAELQKHLPAFQRVLRILQAKLK